jgi:arginyl-tRNA synthetase
MAAQNIYVDMLDRVRRANDVDFAAGVLPAGIDQSRITVEPPRDLTHGDMATNAAMVLAKDAARNRATSRKPSRQKRSDPLIDNAEVAGRASSHHAQAGSLMRRCNRGAA